MLLHNHTKFMYRDILFIMSLPTLYQYHKKPYQAIDPSLPALQQTGRTVIVTGGNSGIGYAIARSFVKANAARVVILGRPKDVVNCQTPRRGRPAWQWYGCTRPHL
jgi:glycerate-2-kinase